MMKIINRYFNLISITLLLLCAALFYLKQSNNGINFAHAGDIIKWEEVEGSKVVYADKILQSNLLQGMSREEIIEKLGKPEYQTEEGVIYYSTIQIFSADPTTFEIHFDSDGLFNHGKLVQG